MNNDNIYSKKVKSYPLIILQLFNIRKTKAKAEFATARHEFCLYICHDDCQTLVVCTRLYYLWPVDGDILNK